SDRCVKTGTFPMGIDFQRLNESSIQPDIITLVNVMKKHLADKKIILSVDRLDYSKGILNKLQCFEKFLEINPDWHRKVNLILIVAPSQGTINQYSAMKKKIDEAVGHINGRFGHFDWNPVLYQYQFLSFENLAALYANADVFLVTPFREGMNLAAKEYIASNRDKTGVLILSEMAGAAKELTDAIIVNPNDVNAMVSAIQNALLMPIHEQIVRNEKMQFYLKSNDVVHWASSFLRILNSNLDKKNSSSKLPEILITKSEIRKQFFNAERRLILLDYDGTLVPFSEKPELAIPGKRVKRILRSLASADKTDVVLVSGRPKNFMDKWFSDLLLNIIAEHGVWGRKIHENWQLLSQFDSSWKTEVNFMLSEYVLKLPGSFVEEKNYAIVFHYRSADPDLASIILPELKTTLDSVIDHSLVEILEGNKILEILCSNSRKGNGISNFLKDNYWPVILAFGDDRTDENMFGELPKHSVSVKVGPSENSTAKYQIKNPEAVLDFLEYLLEKKL
ncbi:trehalose-phosphatase, partial [bacterium]|nr:trehalose-phosphatase [bacterium]